MNNPYHVVYKDISATSPQEISIWLNQMWNEGYELISATGGYFIFKEF